MEAFNACPYHGFDTWLLVSYVYDEISPAMKQLLKTMWRRLLEQKIRGSFGFPELCSRSIKRLG